VFFLGEILPLGDEYKRAVNPIKDFKKLFCKIRHVLRENCQRLSHLDTPFMDVAGTKQDFEKKRLQPTQDNRHLNAKVCWGSSPLNLLEQFEEKKP